MTRRVVLLGCTGSVGEQTLEVVAEFPERFRVVAMAAGRNVEKLAGQVLAHRPELVSVGSEAGARELAERLGEAAPRIVVGDEGLVAVAEHPADLVIAGLVGAVGLAPTLAAVKAGRDIGLANKEVLVMAGACFQRAVKDAGVALLPVDSEHSAIFQVLAGQRHEDIDRLLLTASGGPFRTWSAERIAEASIEEALAHPNWDMGPKITIDSASLMNKALEVIEARWLFDVPPERVSVVVHPQSIVHSLVEFVDGSVIAQLGMPDMKVPIALALSYPERLPVTTPRLDLAAIGQLDFEAPDTKRFPCLDLAWQALAGPETAPAVLNAANEIAVAAFLAGRIRFSRIASVNSRILSEHIDAAPKRDSSTLDDVIAADHAAREAAAALVEEPA